VPSPDDQQRLIAGRYRLRSVLGHGSMGMVWAAYDEFLRRPVAVKEMRLPPGLPATQAEDLRERALREARAIASLSHPNVITLHDVVREEGAPFVVMELLTARSLAGLLTDNGPLSVSQAATIGDALAAALAAAHAAGITHRDVKPGNVLVSDDGRVKLTDFGIARNVSEVTMTSAGLMLGSPAYMAPEVASGKKVTPAADMWGLGATLYAATEGEPPYDADGDPLATASAVVHDDVPEPGPGPLAEVIRGLMTKDPEARLTPADVRASLHDLRAPPGPLFPAELFEHPASPAEEPRPSKPAAEADAGPEAGGTAPLAADPGPLPFATPEPTGAEAAEGTTPPAAETPGLEAAQGTTPPGAAATVAEAPHAPPARSTARTALVVVLATVLFAAAAAGGFALARFLGGMPVLPAQAEGRTPGETPADQQLVLRKGEATMLKGEPGAGFSIRVPANWTKFATQQAVGTLPSSTLIEFVSADGRRVLSIERFGEFFPNRTFDDYLQALRTSWPTDGFELVDRERLRAGDTVFYRTVESAKSPEAAGPGARALGRTTFAQLREDGSNLWVVSVTVPTEQERGGRARLFDRLLPTFTIS
jgi:hypothetical protein